MRITPIMPITPTLPASNRQNQFQDGNFRRLLQKNKQPSTKTNGTNNKTSYTEAYSCKE